MVPVLVLVLVALVITRRVVPRGAGQTRFAALEIRSITGDNLAILLAGADIAQLMLTGAHIDIGLGLPNAGTAIAVIGLLLVVTATISKVALVLVGILGLVAGLIDAAVNDGPTIAIAVLIITMMLWVMTVFTRLLHPTRS